MGEWGGSVVAAARDMADDRTDYGYEKHIDCNSALALIGLILFIDILRDIIAGLPNLGRKRRAAAPWEASLAEVRRSPFAAPLLSGAALEDLVQTTPGLLAAMGAEQWGTGAPGSCSHLTLCEKGSGFATRHGAAGRLLYTLYTNVLGRVFSGGDSSREGTLLEAARAGRTGQDCYKRYPDCTAGNQDQSRVLQEHVDGHGVRFKDMAGGNSSVIDHGNLGDSRESMDDQVLVTEILERRDNAPEVLNVLDHEERKEVLENLDDISNNMLNDFRESI